MSGKVCSLFGVRCARLQGTIVWATLDTRVLYQSMRLLSGATPLPTFNVSRHCMVSRLTNHLRAFSHLRRTLLPRVSYWFWDIGLACEVTGLQASWLLLVAAHEGDGLPAEMARQRRTVTANTGVQWLRSWKWRNWLSEGQQIVLEIRIIVRRGRRSSFWSAVGVT